MAFYRPTTNQGTIDALGILYRALRAWRFYPQGHPTRRSSLNLSYAAMQELQDGNTLLLACGRTGFSFPDGEFLKDPSGQSAALAYELFVRRVQKITFLSDLFQEDLLELCKILCLTPDEIKSAGGIDTIMAERGIRSICVNEFDLTAIQNKRRKIEQSGIIPLGIDESETGVGGTPVLEEELPKTEEISQESQFQALIGRLTTCIDDDVYLILTRQALACADMLQLYNEPHMLFPLIELFASHASDIARCENMRECARFAIEQIIANPVVLQRLLEQTGGDNTVSKVALHAVLKAGGTTAIIAAIEFMGRTSNLKARRTVSIMLGSLGEIAVPALLNQMHDTRWFITRNICGILGVIASGESLAALITCIHHSDLRVRKEAIRSLAQLGGHGAEAALLGVMRGNDTALFPQAIASLGGLQSKKALPELMEILLSRDMFLKSLALKIDVVAAIAMIGDRQVTVHLVNLLEERHLLASARWRQLKSAIAVCLGKLGDARAVPTLEKLVSGGGELAPVYADAIVMIEKSGGSAGGSF